MNDGTTGDDVVMPASDVIRAVPEFDEVMMPSIRSGCHDHLADWFSIEPAWGVGSRPRLRLDYFIDVFLRLSGSEVEGREMSLGVIIGPPPTPGSRLLLVDDLQLDDTWQSRIANCLFGAKMYRDLVVGRANGVLGQSFVLLNPRDGHVLGLYDPSPEEYVSSTHELYMAITSDPRYTAIWLKPASSIRVYNRGKFVAQAIRLRDGLGWSIRIIEHLERRIQDVIERTTGIEIDERDVRAMTELLCEVSESRIGCSIYVVADGEMFEAMVTSGRARLYGSDVDADVLERAGDVRVTNYQPEGWSIPIYRRRREAMLNLLEQDGATVVSADGQVIASRTYFDGPGGRRQIGRWMCSNDRNRVAGLVVSQDGPLYVGGEDIGGTRHFEEIDDQRFL